MSLSQVFDNLIWNISTKKNVSLDDVLLINITK